MFITSHIGLQKGSINLLADNGVLNKYINHGQNYLVPATAELILLNNRWQRRIREEKEQKRKTLMMIEMENDSAEQNDTIENQLCDDGDIMLSSVRLSNGESLDFRSIVPVAKVIVPVENTREYISEQFTLNKNQKAAFMIITGHLDGLNRLNEGRRM